MATAVQVKVPSNLVFHSSYQALPSPVQAGGQGTLIDSGEVGQAPLKVLWDTSAHEGTRHFLRSLRSSKINAMQ